MIGKLEMVVLDAADIGGLAAFYEALAGWSQVSVEDDWITLGTPDGWRVAVQEAPDHRPPDWPGQQRPQQAHLDLRVADLEAGTARAVELGATVLRRNEAWHTLADPAGHPFDMCLAPDNDGVTLMGVMLDCPDARRLALFYSEVLGKPLTYEGEGAMMIGEDGAQPIMFQAVADYSAPRWPDPAYPQQLHLDIEVDDLDAGEAAVLAAGATRQPSNGRFFRVFTDPAGKPFCLTVQPG
ncbi:VOC family protein [Dactylosporangium vinaceum]|uniref:VOC family protein n=1 Tax=Dactylosporangium vinaceum TaxID=53362 RepID=A0ABV5MRI4_9ACTN|nr:VOC family protein [Dactylosporangium vinaceum]UAC00436.1 VOC family protein [Dactylosporangium vinaceum]